MRRTFEQEFSDEQIAWFQDNRSGCEKQTVYFERMRYLQAELITVEQKNLISAMERLKQLTYPRRKPVVLNCSRQRKYARTDELKSKEQGHSLVDRNEDHRYHNRRGRNLARNRNAGVLPLNPTPVIVSIESKKNDGLGEKNLVRHRLQGKGAVQYQANNKLVHLMDTDARTTISRVLFPSLPCIPNVGHRAHIEKENQFKILELAHGEFQTCRLSAQPNVSRGRNKGLLSAKERKIYHCTKEGSPRKIRPAENDRTKCEKNGIKYENIRKCENNRTKCENRTKREHNGTGCANNDTKCEHNGTGCENNDAKCEHNGTGCANNDTKCEHNGTGCENNDANSEKNETERQNSATEWEMYKTESTLRNVKSRTKIEVECPRECKDPDERIVPPPTRANSGSKNKSSEECSPTKVILNFTLQR